MDGGNPSDVASEMQRGTGEGAGGRAGVLIVTEGWFRFLSYANT